MLTHRFTTARALCLLYSHYRISLVEYSQNGEIRNVQLMCTGAQIRRVSGMASYAAVAHGATPRTRRWPLWLLLCLAAASAFAVWSARPTSSAANIESTAVPAAADAGEPQATCVASNRSFAPPVVLGGR